MRWQVNKVRDELDCRVERAVVLQLLRDDHERRWPTAELEDKLADIEQDVLSSALSRLVTTGVVSTENGAVWASDAARRLDELELIGV
jgi:DNA-binding HxlR family transcriptional regulator